VQDVPFATPADHAAWLGFVFGLLSRWSHRGNIPLFFTEAPVPGAGKSKLISVALLIAGEKPMPHVLPKEEEEIRKTLTYIARGGDRVVFYDNVVGTLKSASLDRALTGYRTWKDRILGQSMGFEGPLETVFCASGNNATLSFDLLRRAQLCRISPIEEDPTKRIVRIRDWEGWTKRNAPRLRRAALSILHAYATCGTRVAMPEWGSFTEWSDIARGAVVWAGWADPQEASGIARAEESGDETLDELESLLGLVHKRGPCTSAEIESWLTSSAQRDRQDTGALRALWRGMHGSTQVGRRISYWRGRVLAGRRLVQQRVGRGRKWAVEAVG
jgi:hypothetical protein